MSSRLGKNGRTADIWSNAKKMGGKKDVAVDDRKSMRKAANTIEKSASRVGPKGTIAPQEDRSVDQVTAALKPAPLLKQASVKPAPLSKQLSLHSVDQYDDEFQEKALDSKDKNNINKTTYLGNNPFSSVLSHNNDAHALTTAAAEALPPQGRRILKQMSSIELSNDSSNPQSLRPVVKKAMSSRQLDMKPKIDVIKPVGWKPNLPTVHRLVADR